MFKNVIVRRPCKAMVEGITSAPELGKPDYELALKQHDDYIEALKKCGVNVTVLEADERYPDSCFVEDPAVITRECAIITNPGAASRNGCVPSSPIVRIAGRQLREPLHIRAPGSGKIRAVPRNRLPQRWRNCCVGATKAEV